MRSEPRLAPPPTPTLTRRRAAVFSALDGGVMVLPAAPIQFRSRDTETRYRPDSELYYTTGAVEPESVAVLVGGDEPHCVLFVRPRDSDAELWAGPRLGPEETRVLLGVDACHPTTELSERLPALLQRGSSLHYRQRPGGALQRLVDEAMRSARSRGPRLGSGPRALVDPGEILDELRLVKDEHEIIRLREAARISVEGHHAGAAAMAVGVGEWVVEAAVDGAFRRGGAHGPGYPTIVGSGPNACVLHYVDNADTIGADALVLLDAGAEYGLYNGDITRTYPASGSFSPEQAAVYEVVDAARKAGVEASLPGNSIAEVHAAAERVVVEGLVQLGVLTGSVEDLVAERAHRAFFPHQTSHWLGLDVHDPGDYARAGVSRKLVPGMVFTVEPGLYFRPGTGGDAAERFSGIGIRIEDNVLITPGGQEVLTGAMPTAPTAVSALVGAR